MRRRVNRRSCFCTSIRGRPRRCRAAGRSNPPAGRPGFDSPQRRQGSTRSGRVSVIQIQRMSRCPLRVYSANSVKLPLRSRLRGQDSSGCLGHSRRVRCLGEHNNPRQHSQHRTLRPGRLAGRAPRASAHPLRLCAHLPVRSRPATTCPPTPAGFPGRPRAPVPGGARSRPGWPAWRRKTPSPRCRGRVTGGVQ